MRKLAVVVAVLFFLGYLATGIVVVEPNEEVVVRRFGKAHRLSLPAGLHFEWPAGFSRVDRVRVDSTRQVTIGTPRAETDRGLEIDEADLSAEGRFLTGDQNLIQLAVTVQYSISDPKAFLYSGADVDRLIAAATESTLTELTSRLPVDEILLNPQIAVGDPLRERLQESLRSRYGLGAAVRSVNVSPAPPAEVLDAFEDVARARSDKEKKINDARSYADRTGRQASATAARVVDEATTYSERRRAEAESDAAKFADLLAAVKESDRPAAAAQRLFLEAIENLFPRLKKVLVEADASGEPIELSIWRELDRGR